MWGEMALSLRTANGYVLAILLIGFVGTLIFFERTIMYQFVFQIDFNKFLQNLKKMVAAEDLERAMAHCRSISGTSLPRIGLKALEGLENDPSKVRGIIEEETIDFLPSIERRLGILPACTLIIMLVGLLGTIDALWEAFHSIDVLDTAKKQATLAQGIANSLNSTAIGLLFAMLLLSGHYFLRGYASALTERIHYGVTVLINLLVPQEAVAMMPMGMVAGHGNGEGNAGDVAEAGSEGDQSARAPTSGENNSEESFDDVSVEDIKDEEEII